jgi:hypothetical protein
MASERLSPALILLITALITTIVLLFSPIKPPKEDFAA